VEFWNPFFSAAEIVQCGDQICSVPCEDFQSCSKDCHTCGMATVISLQTLATAVLVAQFVVMRFAVAVK